MQNANFMNNMQSFPDSTPMVDIFRQFFFTGFEILFPALAVSLVIVLIVAIGMAVMQINEQTLTFIPKLVGFVVVLWVLGPWMWDRLITLINDTWEMIPKLL